MDAALHENGTACPACALRREEANRRFSGPANVPCNNCNDTGRVSAGVDNVIRRNVDWARAHYWPERERRWKIQNEGL